MNASVEKNEQKSFISYPNSGDKYKNFTCYFHINFSL